MHDRDRTPSDDSARARPRLPSAGITAVLLFAFGCSGSPAADESATGDEVLSNSGALRLTLTSSPDDVPVRGENQIELAIVSAADGEPVEGLSLSMVPYMPAMGHGSPIVPNFSELGSGHYRFDDVVLTMPGLWELRTSVSAPESDKVSFRFDVQ